MKYLIAAILALAFVTMIALGTGVPNRPAPRPATAPGKSQPTEVPRAVLRTLLPSSASDASPGSWEDLMRRARRRVHEAQACWKVGFWEQGFTIHPPLPEDQAFWTLVKELKRELGKDAPIILDDMIHRAASGRMRDLYAALLAGLKDPAAEPLLTALARDSALEVDSMAVYGLALLGTESAWKTTIEIWKGTPAEGRSNYFHAIGLLGARALPYILEQVSESKHPELKYWAFEALRAPEIRDQLWQLSETAADKDVRIGAFRAACRDPDAAVFSRLFDLVEGRSELRLQAIERLRSFFTYDGHSLGSEPRLLERVLTRWDDLPLDVRWSLWGDPAVRKLKPDALDGLAEPEHMKWTVVYALTNDPAQHARLAEYAASHPGESSLWFCMEPLRRQGGFSDSALSDLVRRFALTPPENENDVRQGWALQMLPFAPPELRSQVLNDYVEQAARISTIPERLSALSRLSNLGADAGPLAERLLRSEADPNIRLELITTALSLPGHETQIRELAAAEIGQILSGSLEAGLRFAAAYPGERDDGLRRYGALVRQVFSAYGTLEDAQRIGDYYARLMLPAELRSKVKESDARESLESQLQESIDAIRARN